MAESKNNIIMRGMSGKVADMLVFRQRGLKTVVTRVPRPGSKRPTNPQEAVKANFRKSAAYGKRVMADPALKAVYDAATTGNQSAYNLALKDAYNAPVIHDIDISAYNGAAGSIITITASDNFKVKMVGLRIERTDGSLVESGDAVQVGKSDTWIYTTTQDNLNRVRQKVTVSAVDLPENVTVKEIILS